MIARCEHCGAPVAPKAPPSRWPMPFYAASVVSGESAVLTGECPVACRPVRLLAVPTDEFRVESLRAHDGETLVSPSPASAFGLVDSAEFFSGHWPEGTVVELTISRVLDSPTPGPFVGILICEVVP